MMQDHFLRLFDYNHWANGLFAGALTPLAAEMPHAVRLYSHILHAHRVWLDRIAGLDPAFDFWAPLPPVEWEPYETRCHRESKELVGRADLQAKAIYRNSRGQAFENSVQDILHHVLNHSTHHRGQLATFIRQYGAAPPPADYILYLRG